MALYLLYRGIRNRAYFRHLGERLGFLPKSLHSTGSTAIWFHAVSVGEVLSAVELIRRLRSQQPGVSIYVSTTTLAGRAVAEQRLAGLAQGIFFLPLDYRSMVRRVLHCLRPSAVVILETEIWPNLYRESKRAGASLILVNGRISDRSLPRYRSASGFFRHALSFADAILTQTEEDARRFVIAGAPESIISAAGNVKFDFSAPSSGIALDVAAFLDRMKPSAVWVAASTMPQQEPNDPDEDDAVIAAFSSLNRPDLLLILAPRRPERFDLVAGKLASSGLPFARRSNLASPSGDVRVLLLDSIGELAALFERATVVFMGGTLASRGGHNILEPAYFAKPVVVGPHMENFAAIAEEFAAHGAILRIPEVSDLAPAVASLLDDAERAQTIGSKARELALSKRGVADRIAAAILKHMSLGVPNPPRTLPARITLTPLTWLWRAGHRINMNRPARSLSTKVISIGALTMGGAGKTPVVAHLAERLSACGKSPAILTRGYKRDANQTAIVARGESAANSLTGDEAQIFLNRGVAHLGIGADRYSAGRRLEDKLHPGVFLLDDGFQHFRLKRDQDIVLVDALNPLAGGVFPLGRLREPFANIGRATIVLITRLEPGQNSAGIEALVRRFNKTAPIFRCFTTPREWARFSGPEISKPFARVGAFCGLGSPDSFWRTLAQLSLEVAFREAFRDHHPYSPTELSRLLARAHAERVEALVTTEKDIVNLRKSAAVLRDAAPQFVQICPLYWLKIDVEIENEQELLRLL